MVEMQQRKLAAIMFTDIVGYSALTQRNESVAMEILDEHFELLRSVFPLFGGREIKTIGDSFLIEFASILEAVRAGRRIQAGVESYNLTANPDRRIMLRIGIHMGDVIIRDGDVFGDGVNIASRIEHYAEPGGICVSEDIYNQLRRNKEFDFQPLGMKHLKNIETPVALYKVLAEGEAPQLSFFQQVSSLAPHRANMLVGSMTAAAALVFGISLYLPPGQTSAAGETLHPAEAGVAERTEETPPSEKAAPPPAAEPKPTKTTRTSPTPVRQSQPRAYLVLKGHHDLDEGTLYLLSEGDLIRQVDLTHEKDDPGAFEVRVPVTPGSHDLEVRVRSSKENIDESRIVVAAFERDQTRTLYLRLVKSGGFLGMKRSRELKVEWVE